MFPKYSAMEYEQQCTEAGKGSDVYKHKVAWLKQKWPKTHTVADETRGMRLVGPLIHSETSHLDIALIADNLDAFKKHYKDYFSAMNPRQLLDQACLCGSKTVIEFLLDELKLNYLSLGYEYLLAYVAASPNVEWAKELAQHMASAGKKVPDDLCIFARAEGQILVGSIFREYQGSTGSSAKNKPIS